MDLIQNSNATLWLSKDTEITAKKTGVKGKEEILLIFRQGTQFAQIWFNGNDKTKILRDINTAILYAKGSDPE